MYKLKSQLTLAVTLLLSVPQFEGLASAVAVTWTSPSGTTLDYNIEAGSGTAAVVGGNLVLTAQSNADFDLVANAGVSATDATFFNKFGTAAIVANPVPLQIQFSYIEQSYTSSPDTFRGQELFINGAGGGANNNRIQLGSDFGPPGISAFMDLKWGPGPTVDKVPYISSTHGVADDSSGLTPLARQDFAVHNVVITRNVNGTVAINYDGVLFNTATAPIAMNALSLATNGGIAWGVDQIEFRFRGNGTTFSPTANNTYTITNFSVVALPEPSTFVLSALAGVGLLVAARRRARRA